MAEQVEFRNATVTDEGILFELYARVMQEYVSRIWGWDVEWQIAEFRQHFEPENVTVVYDNDSAVGYLHVEEQQQEFYIRMLLLLPSHQGMGIGTRLLEQVIEKARLKSKGIILQVFKINVRARKFYQQHGFQMQGESPDSFILSYPFQDKSVGY